MLPEPLGDLSPGPPFRRVEVHTLPDSPGLLRRLGVPAHRGGQDLASHMRSLC